MLREGGSLLFVLCFGEERDERSRYALEGKWWAEKVSCTDLVVSLTIRTKCGCEY